MPPCRQFRPFVRQHHHAWPFRFEHRGLDDEFVSSTCARPNTDPATGKWAIEDLGSTNGTVVNQQRLNAPMILGSRVPVRIGATTFELR